MCIIRLIHTIYQQAVVGRSVTVEKVNKGLYVLHREGQVVAVALVDAVQTRTHPSLVSLAGATGYRQEQDKYGQKLFHSACKITKYF